MEDPSYVTYVRYAKMIGNPVMDYETWARTCHKLDKGETEVMREREKWLASEKDSVQRKEERDARRAMGRG